MSTSMGDLPRTLGICLLGVLVAVVLVAATQTRGFAQAADAFVGPGESIQKAINAADPGDTIVVKGVHREDVVIRKDGIKLRGDDAVIEAPTRAKADSLCSRAFGPEAICVLGDENINTDKLEGPRVSDVSISGFTIRGFDIEADEASVIDVYGARNTTVVGNRTTGNVAGGIVIGRSINTTIANNDFLGNPMGNPARDAEGIDINPDSRNTKIVNNVVRRYDQGIIADEAVGTTIVGNDSIGNAIAGIGVGDSPGTKILSNTTRRNGFAELVFLGGSPGANAEPVNAKIAGNDLSGANFGVYVANAQGGSFAANEVHNNCAGVVFFSDFGPPSGNFEVKGNQVENNTRKCPAEQGGEAYSGIGIGLFGTRGMEVTGNHLSGNVPSGPSAVSGGVVVGVDPLFGGTTKPKNNSVTGNHFGPNKPDIFWDESGTGNRFVGNLCDTSVPSRLCN